MPPAGLYLSPGWGFHKLKFKFGTSKMGNATGIKDASLKGKLALPNGAAAVVLAVGIDLGPNSNRGDFLPPCEALLSAPAMNATQMPNAKTLTYDIIHSDNADLSSPTTLVAGCIVQTGAGGVGCPAASYRWKPPTSVKRYVGFRATGSASGDATGAIATLEMAF